jgi:hypothetical protein
VTLTFTYWSWVSCEILALRENFLDRPESYDSFSAKNCIFLAHEKTRTVWDIFLHSHSQPDPKQGIKKLQRHFPATLVLSITNLANIWHRPEQHWKSHSLICHIRDLDVWSRCKGKSNFVRLVMVIFWYLVFGQVVYGNGEIYPQTVRKKYTTFSTERIVALRSVNKIFPENYEFSANLEWSLSERHLPIIFLCDIWLITCKKKMLK